MIGRAGKNTRRARSARCDQVNVGKSPVVTGAPFIVGCS
jgi:hypothetical protein